MTKNISKFMFGLALTISVISTSLLNTTSSFAQSIGDISLANQWLRSTPPAARVAGGYLRITNNGSQADTLVAVEFTGAKKSEIHEMKMVEGVMKMRPLRNGIEIQAGGSVLLKPGAEHLMLMGLKEQLVDGQIKKLKLRFASAGEITLEFPVMTREKGRKLTDAEE